MLIEKINADFISAYKNKEMSKKDFLGVLKTEVTKESKTPSDAYIVGKVKSMIKNASASNSLTSDELEILNSYLPKQLNEGELTSIIESYKYLHGYSNMKDMGFLMKTLKEEYNGQYDGALASKLVKKLLS